MSKRLEKQESETLSVSEKKKIFTLFILFFPSVLIGLIPATVNNSIVLPLSIKVLLIFYQFVVLKNFIDQHYD